MSFTSYLSPRAIWDRLVGRRTIDSEMEERFDARFLGHTSLETSVKNGRHSGHRHV